MEVSFPRSGTMTWLRDLMGFNSSLPQLVWEKCFVVIVVVVVVVVVGSSIHASNMSPGS